MKHADHVGLLRPADLPTGGAWADLGAGSGAFTLALRELVGAGAIIHAVDKDQGSLRELEHAYMRRFNESGSLHRVEADFTAGLDLPALDGVLMANSLHFHRDKRPILERIHGMLWPGGLLLVVEYNVDRGNPWVPYPFSFDTFRGLARQAGFQEPQLLAKVPSSFLREIYSAFTRTR